jgi:hypothetical protein
MRLAEYAAWMEPITRPGNHCFDEGKMKLSRLMLFVPCLVLAYIEMETSGPVLEEGWDIDLDLFIIRVENRNSNTTEYSRPECI